MQHDIFRTNCSSSENLSADEQFVMNNLFTVDLSDDEQMVVCFCVPFLLALCAKLCYVWSAVIKQVEVKKPMKVLLFINMVLSP